MSKIATKLKEPIEQEMRLFEQKFYEAIASDIPLIKRINLYITKRKGKQLRPILVFLSAKLFGEVTEKTYRFASIIELTHTATLVHDDVVDESNLRRGIFSINALWNNKIAILVGDYMLAKGLSLSSGHNDSDIMTIYTRAIAEMSEGELLQIEKARRLDITEEVYLEIIRQKTATLMESCCEGGAVSVGVSKEVSDKMRKFGEYMGIAFQIKDDLFDYQKTNLIGKPVGIDIQEQKMTLPLIYCLNKADKKQRNWMINVVKKHNKNKKKVQELIDYVKQNGGLDYASNVMKDYQEKARDVLKGFPENQSRKALEMLLDYIIERSH